MTVDEKLQTEAAEVDDFKDMLLRRQAEMVVLRYIVRRCRRDCAKLARNVVGAQKVEIVGHRKPVEKSALIKAVTSLLK